MIPVLNLLPCVPMTLQIHMIRSFPKMMKPTLRLLPHKWQEFALLSALGSVFKEAIEDGEFAFLQGRWLKISITDLGLCWLLSAKEGQLIMAPKNSSLKEEVSFSAKGDDLLLIAARKEDPDTLFFQRRLKIEGDTELGLEVKNLIDAIDLDILPSVVHKTVALCAGLIINTQHLAA